MTEPETGTASRVRAWPLVIARIYVGTVFAAAGIGQLSRSSDWTEPGQSWPDALQAQLAQWIPHSAPWYRAVETILLMPHASLLAPLVSVAHIVVGALLILGFWTQGIALIAAFLLLNYIAAEGTVIYGAGDPTAYLALVVTVWLGRAGDTWGLDAILDRGRRAAAVV